LDYARFVRAQDPVWTNVIAELTLGAKQSHWMWFVFPQLRGLGSSEMSAFFGLSSLADANDYLAHPILCERLKEASALLLNQRGRSIEAVLGATDAQKLQSSMTLFSKTAGMADCATEVLETFFAGVTCDQTEARLAPTPETLPGE